MSKLHLCNYLKLYIHELYNTTVAITIFFAISSHSVAINLYITNSYKFIHKYYFLVINSFAIVMHLFNLDKAPYGNESNGNKSKKQKCSSWIWFVLGI